MGLLDTALGMLSGGANSGADGDPKMKLAQAAISMFSSGESGGLQGVVASLQQSGLGDAVNSWISNGHNLPVSAEQIQQALSGGQLEQLADAAGLSHSDAASHLAELLPGIINHLTPDGTLPVSGTGNATGLLESLASSFLSSRSAAQ